MLKSPIMFKLWGVLIGALGVWHIVNWVQNTSADKSIYALGIGIFCVVMGVGALLISPKMFDKKDEN